MYQEYGAWRGCLWRKAQDHIGPVGGDGYSPVAGCICPLVTVV